MHSHPYDPCDTPDISAYTGPLPAHVPKGARVINMGKMNEIPSEQAQRLLQAMFVNNTSRLTPSATRRAIADVHKGWEILFQQRMNWTPRKARKPCECCGK